MREITDINEWEDFNPLQEKGIFLQSAGQKELYELLGQKTWLYEYESKHGHKTRSLVTKISAKRGTFLYLPYGIMMEDKTDMDSLENFVAELRALAKSEGASFIRISPYWVENQENKQILKRLNFTQAPIHMLAETLWILDLDNKTEEDLMMGMEKKHRNLVRRAGRDGVEIKISTDSEAVERFINLHWQTVGRHNFTPYPKDYFRKQVELFSKNDEVQVIEAYLGDDLLASAIIMYYGKVGAYHHGASSSKPEHRKIPASYLLQWEAIKEAQKRGCTRYNFWGISPNKNPKHPFYGITHFKTGFGGYQHDLIPCHDLVLNNKYYLNWIVETARKWKRGF